MSANRLLVIDDEPDLGAFVRKVAESCGYEVRTTSDGRSFEAAYRSFRPDLIMLDLAIPQTDGIELLRFLADERCDAKVLVLSGFESRIREAAERLGQARGLKMIGTLSKPIRAADLRQRLSDLLQES